VEAQKAQQAQQEAVGRLQKCRIQGYVNRKTREGLIVDLSVFGGVSHNATDIPMGIKNPIGDPTWRGSKSVLLRGHPDQENLADGEIVDVVAYDSGPSSAGVSTYRSYTFYSR